MRYLQAVTHGTTVYTMITVTRTAHFLGGNVIGTQQGKDCRHYIGQLEYLQIGGVIYHLSQIQLGILERNIITFTYQENK